LAARRQGGHTAAAVPSKPTVGTHRDPGTRRGAASWKDAHMTEDGGDPNKPGHRDPLARLRAAAASRHSAGLRRSLRPRSPDHDGLLDLASNDYLGLSRDPRLIEGAINAARRWGVGATGSRLVSGTTALHAALEATLADFTGSPAALVFSSGYLANLAAVTALAAALGAGSGRPADRTGFSRLNGPKRSRTGRPANSGVLIVSDAANHASLIDACRLANARIAVTPHADVAAVQKALASRCEETAMVVTDAVFSVSGTLAPIAELLSVARAHDALLLVDEAHAFGVVGPGGRGAVYAAGLAAEPAVVRTITLSKAIAGQGGAVLGAPEVIQTLIDTGRSFIFDTGLAPASVGAAFAGLDVLITSPELPGLARERARQVASIGSGLGLATSRPDAAIVSATFGTPEAAVAARNTCAAHGIRVACFRPPSVPPGGSCLRLAARPNLTDADLETVGRALAAVHAQGLKTVASPEEGNRP
jgi:8-amino-7-oxononanoate synthase